MKLSKNSVRALVVLMVAALGGLVYLQYRLLRTTLDLKEQTFRSSVFAALNEVADRLEEIEARNRIFLVHDDSPSTELKFKPFDGAAKRGNSSYVATAFTTSKSGVNAWLENNRVRYSLTHPQNVLIRAYNVLGKLDTTFVNGPKPAGDHEIPLPKERLGSGITFIQVKTDSSMSTLRWEPGTVSLSVTVEDREESKNKIAQRVFRSFLPRLDEPGISKRVSQDMLDSLIASSLKQNAVTLPYEFIVENNADHRVEFSRPASLSPGAIKSDFSTLLYPHGLTLDPNVLTISFPSYNAYLVKEYTPELAASALLLGAIVFCFWYTVRTIVRQKEFAGRLSDFINNMTHEFKTPISTIALASEGIAQQRGPSGKQKITRYNKVIADENKRMKNQVDKILQMATLEEGEHEFNLVPLNVHEIIQKAVENIALQISSRDGAVTTTLSAARSRISGDAVHIENVIHNVLENAQKYSPDAPRIEVRTANEANDLIVTVADNGIGIPPVYLDKVFDKYYRVPTGNVHDVKGFGLGLSYVRLIAEAHRGSVTLSSTPGRGTTVTLRFPVAP